MSLEAEMASTAGHTKAIGFVVARSVAEVTGTVVSSSYSGLMMSCGLALGVTVRCVRCERDHPRHVS